MVSPHISSYPAAMQRIVVILALFVLLMNGRHIGMAPPAPFGALAVEAHALPLDEAGTGEAFGPLRLTGAWHLTSSHGAFGGISSLTALENGELIGLSDSGELMGFRVGQGAGPGFVKPLPRAAAEQDWPRWRWDSESMVRDPATGRAWVGFEHLQRICRYAPGFTEIERCVTPPEMQDWPATGGIESLVRLDHGRFLAIAERAVDRSGAYEVLLWQGDPVDPRTPPAERLGYRAPAGYRPTDALWLGGGRLLVLNRRLTLAEGFTARLSLVRVSTLQSGTILQGSTIATLAPPGLADNFEALALGREDGWPVLWIASDDNRFALQRTLLLRFALPPEWDGGVPHEARAY